MITDSRFSTIGRGGAKANTIHGRAWMLMRNCIKFSVRHRIIDRVFIDRHPNIVSCYIERFLEKDCSDYLAHYINEYCWKYCNTGYNESKLSQHARNVLYICIINETIHLHPNIVKYGNNNT